VGVTLKITLKVIWMKELALKSIVKGVNVAEKPSNQYIFKRFDYILKVDHIFVYFVEKMRQTLSQRQFVRARVTQRHIKLT
jgi:hypothetical protein